MERILVSGPSITQKEIDYVTDAVTNAWYANANIYHERFEKAFADYLGCATPWRYPPALRQFICLCWRSVSGLAMK